MPGFDHDQRGRATRFVRALFVRGVLLSLLSAGACLGVLAGVAQAAAPTNTVPPSIQGTTQVGQTLYYTPGTWSVPSGTMVNGQWEDCDPTCAPIPGTMNDPSYQLRPTDVGGTIEIVETATNSNFPSVQAASNILGPVTAPTTTSLVVSPGNPVADQTVTLAATVTSAAGSAPPSGSLTFEDNGAPIAGCAGLGVSATDQSATVTCQTAFPASSAALTAAFTPAPGTFVTASTSPATTVSIGRASSSTSLGSPADVNVGSNATYTATVTGTSGGGPARPSGTVTFLDAGKPIAGCGNRTVVSQRASCTVTYTRVGKHQIAAIYGGDGNFAGSGSSTDDVTARQIPPTGYVTAYMSWTFYYGPSHTTVGGLVVSGLAKATSISTSCTGHGCAFRRHTTVVKAPKRCGKRTKKCTAPKTLNLKSIFRGRALRVGTQITVRITHRSWVGKYYKFTIRSGRKPRIQESCLAVGGTRPGVGCT